MRVDNLSERNANISPTTEEQKANQVDCWLAIFFSADPKFYPENVRL